jgi:hypothetical protein
MSGRTAGQIHALSIDKPIAVGDLDGDGVTDIAGYASKYSKAAKTDLGEIRVWSSVSGTKILTIAPAGRTNDFGREIAAIGDWNGDGTPDLVVGVNGSLAASIGTLAVFSLADGSVLGGVHGVVAYSTTGPPIATIGDLDGDGTLDLVVTNLYETVGAYMLAGVVRLVPGATLQTIAQFDGSSTYEFLHLLGVPGDVDGDGAHDLVIGPSVSRIYWCHSGRTRRKLYAVQSPLADFHHVATGADIDGDGLAEIVASQERNEGLVIVDRGRTAFLTIEPSFRSNRSGWSGVPPTFPPPPGLFMLPPPSAPGAPPNVCGGLPGWSFSYFAANLMPGTAATLQITEWDGLPVNLVVGTGTADGAGEWIGAFAVVPPGGAPVVGGVQLVGTDRNGAAVTTAIERFVFD